MSQTIIVTGADLAQQALDLLTGYDIVYAGKTPTEEDMVALCGAHNPVAIIVRYGKVGAAAMDLAKADAWSLRKNFSVVIVAVMAG